jgi:O-succinylbenzoate synthase
MIIDSIHLFRVRSSPGEIVLVQLHAGQQSGWGEACVGREPVESDEWAGGVFACLRDVLAPAVLGQSVLSGEQIQELIGRFRGNRAARSALDCAWWDLRAKTHASTIAAMLGGSRSDSTASLTIDVLPTIDELLAEIERNRDACDVLLLKYRPGWDVEVLRAVRQVYPATPLAIDCDGCCSLSQREMLYRLDDFMLRWIEQPFAADDLVAHAMLQEQIRTPICLHQSITSVERAEQALDLGSGGMFKIDPTLTGGLTAAQAIHDAAAAAVPLAVAGVYQTVAGERSHRALATLAGFTLPADRPVLIFSATEELPAALRESVLDHAVL